VRVVDVSKTAVRVLVFEFHRARPLQNDALRDLKFFVFHSVRHPHNHLLLLLGGRNF